MIKELMEAEREISRVRWLLFTDDGNVAGSSEYVKDDPNEGIPLWAFHANLIMVQVNYNEGWAEWVPPVGPAPIWKDNVTDPREIWEKLNAFIEENF